MNTNFYKVYVVATTEFGSAIRTKSFLVGILLLPVIMGLSIGLQIFVADRVDTKPRKFVVIDRSGALYPAIEEAALAHNAKLPEARGRNARPRMEPELEHPPARAKTLRPWDWSLPTAFIAATSTPTWRFRLAWWTLRPTRPTRSLWNTTRITPTMTRSATG